MSGGLGGQVEPHRLKPGRLDPREQRARQLGSARTAICEAPGFAQALQVAHRSFGGNAFGRADSPGCAFLSVQAFHGGPQSLVVAILDHARGGIRPFAVDPT